jgi:hypothetical protein
MPTLRINPILYCICFEINRYNVNYRQFLDSLQQSQFGYWKLNRNSLNDIDPSKLYFYISPRYSLNDIADLLWKHLESIGETSNILTIYEIKNSYNMKNSLTFGMDESILLGALSILEQRGRCAIMRSRITSMPNGDINLSEVGVKFLGSS